MSIEAELSEQVYHLMDSQNEFSKGTYTKINEFISDEFQGTFFRPQVGEIESFDSKQMKAGNRDAATLYKDKDIRFIYSGLSVVPQSRVQAAVSFECFFKQDNKTARALFLQVWRREADGRWRMIREYTEKGPME